jgi:purine-nucleoside phosphorylase
MEISETIFRQNHLARCQEWRRAAQNWVFGEEKVLTLLGPYMILVHSSQGNPEDHILPHMMDIEVFNEFIQGHGCARGWYKGTEIWLLHHPMGSTSAQMWMECLQGTPIRYLIALGEMTSYPDTVRVGDIVLPTTAIRGDMITDYHVASDVPASCDPDLLFRMLDRLTPSGWPIHVGPVYSGMPGGIGVYNPIMKEKVWEHLQAGILGNAMETSLTYLEGARLGIKVVDAWAVSDDISCGYWDDSPNGWNRWKGAWNLIALAALDTLADLNKEKG